MNVRVITTAGLRQGYAPEVVAPDLFAALAAIHPSAPIAWDAQGIGIDVVEDPDLPGIDIVVVAYAKVVAPFDQAEWKIIRVYARRTEGDDQLPYADTAFDYFEPTADLKLGLWRVPEAASVRSWRPISSSGSGVPETATAPATIPCEMMIDGPDAAAPRSCGALPTVGTNGLYRYCAAHMASQQASGAMCLKFDDRPPVGRKRSR